MSEPIDIEIPDPKLVDTILFERHDSAMNMIHIVTFIYNDGREDGKIVFEDMPDGARAVYDYFEALDWIHEYDEKLRIHILRPHHEP